MSQRPISAFFGTPVQPCPRVKRNDVVNVILYFRFQDRWTGKKRQEAYNVAQKACSTLFLNTATATLHEFMTQAAVMARQDRGCAACRMIFCSCNLSCAHAGQHRCHGHRLCCNIRIFCLSQPPQICTVLHLRSQRNPKKEPRQTPEGTSNCAASDSHNTNHCAGSPLGQLARQCQKGGQGFHRVTTTNLQNPKTQKAELITCVQTL